MPHGNHDANNAVAKPQKEEKKDTSKPATVAKQAQKTKKTNEAAPKTAASARTRSSTPPLPPAPPSRNSTQQLPLKPSRAKPTRSSTPPAKSTSSATPAAKSTSSSAPANSSSSSAPVTPRKRWITDDEAKRLIWQELDFYIAQRTWPKPGSCYLGPDGREKDRQAMKEGRTTAIYKEIEKHDGVYDEDVDSEFTRRERNNEPTWWWSPQQTAIWCDAKAEYDGRVFGWTGDPDFGDMIQPRANEYRSYYLREKEFTESWFPQGYEWLNENCIWFYPAVWVKREGKGNWYSHSEKGTERLEYSRHEHGDLFGFNLRDFNVSKVIEPTRPYPPLPKPKHHHHSHRGQ